MPAEGVSHLARGRRSDSLLVCVRIAALVLRSACPRRRRDCINAAHDDW